VILRVLLGVGLRDLPHEFGRAVAECALT
jgi:hypothetical protein